MPLSPGICGVVLAAGASSRMGRDKALLPWPPVAKDTPAANTFLGALIDLLEAYSDPVIVVAGRNAPAIAPIVYAHAGFLTINPEPERGQFSSLQAGLQQVLTQGRDAALVALVDRPPVLPKTMSLLTEAFRSATGNIWAVVPEAKRGEHVFHGHPILIGREMMEAFLSAPASSTARDVEHAYQRHICYVSVDDPYVGLNIDTPEDYARLAHAGEISSEKQF